MKKLALGIVLFFTSIACMATPTKVTEQAVADILAIAQNKTLDEQVRKDQLEDVIEKYVDLQAASQRVLAVHWRSASKEEKVEFMRVFRKVLTSTYFNLLQQYENEKVIFGEETIKKKRYATVESTVLSGGKEIPVSYRLLLRDDGWKLYDFVAEGISMIRSFNNDYASMLRSGGVSGLSKTLEDKIAEAN